MSDKAEILEVMAKALFDRDHNGPFAHKGVTRLTFGRDRITYDEVRKGIDNGVYTASALSICHAEAEAALTALEASGRAVVQGWQPIESAPKDGTPLDLWLGNDEDPHRRTDCYWGRPHHECGEYGSYCDNCPPDRDMWVDPLSMGYEDLQPTHWMPLLLPPSKE